MGLAKYGYREIIIGTAAWIGLSALSCLLGAHWLSWAWLVLWVYLLWFFRSPNRRIPAGPGLFVAPADGKVTDITDLDTCEYLDAPAVRIGIFLNVFSVHVNRAPAQGVVDYVRYQPGRKVNAMRPDAGQVNEAHAIGLRDTCIGKLLVRQVAGLIARRIVSEAKLGDKLARGQIYGMIKFGSRTELILPRKTGLLIAVKVGQKVRGGRDVLAQFNEVLAEKSNQPSAVSGQPTSA
ncbi:MAG: phosphatidylserine decarboxylase [Phycisphaerae bacterium]|nr:phosphatidylserine decarboxylase [Phycisphaerae bacterium]